MTNSLRHKNSRDENFSVGLLVSSKLKPLVEAYYQAARLADDIADDPHWDAKEKQRRLDQIEQAFFGRNSDSQWQKIRQLGEIFKSENLDYRLFTDLLTAFRRDSENIQPQIWQQLIDYCNYSAVPVGRFMLAIHNELPSTYLPAASLCTALQLVNHLQDLKYDAILLNRFYLPKQMMEEFGVANSDLYLTKATKPLQNLISHLVGLIRGQLKDAATLTKLTQSFRLRWEIGVIVSLTNSMLKKIEQRDVISHKIKLSKADWLKALGKGLITAIIKK